MPIYLYQCEKCKSRVEIRHGFDGAVPLCCGKAMQRLVTAPSLIRVKDGVTPRRSEGYKAGYSKEYLKSIGKS